MNLRRTSLIALGIGALAVPAAAVAAPGGHGHAHGHGHGPNHGHGHNPTVMYVFKGAYGDPAVAPGVVSVEQGNAHVKKAGLVGQDVAFDLSATKLKVADTTGDGTVTADDVVKGDTVVVLARLPKQDPGAQPFAAKQLVDQTHSADGSGEDD